MNLIYKNYLVFPISVLELLALMILPLLFTNVNIKSKIPGKHWKPSKSELQQGFILCVEV